ncbi:MAG: hypothetical protein IJM30_10295 [Thermoguttaceae bacterium]|nr:hypothetical protein [Thermoguttaceae bacterium]
MEAQTNWIYNIVPRLLLYVLEALKFHYARIRANPYGEKENPFPQIERYVLCPNAGKDVPDVASIKKDLRKGFPSGIDCEVRVLRDGAPEDMINLYVRFTKVGDEQVKKCGRTQRAVVEIIDNCVKKDILAEYLIETRVEAMDAITLPFNDEIAIEEMKKEEYDKGRDEGRNEERENSRKRSLSYLRDVLKYRFSVEPEETTRPLGDKSLEKLDELTSRVFERADYDDFLSGI